MSEIEFFVPDPEEQPKAPAKEVEGDAAQLDAALSPPQLEVELPRRPEPSGNDIRMAARAIEDPDDPMVLLQRELGKLPANKGRAADMAMRTDMALNNLGVTARRMADLERRKEKRAKKRR